MSVPQELEVDSQAFDHIEREFQEVLNELATDQSLERFRQEFDKLHRSLKISHENQRRLISKCRELNSDIALNAGKIQTVLKMTSDDSATIQHLKTELEKNYRILELSKEREEKLQQKIELLQNEMRQLNNIIDQSHQMSSGQTTTVHDLLLSKQELFKQKEMLTSLIAGAKQELSAFTEKYQSLEGLRDIALAQFKQQTQQKIELEERLQKDEDANKQIQEELENIKRSYDQQKAEQTSLLEDKKKLKFEIEKCQLLNHQKTKDIEAYKMQSKKDEKEKIDQRTKIDEQSNLKAQIDEKINEVDDQLQMLQQELTEIEENYAKDTRRNVNLKQDLEKFDATQKEADRLKELSINGVNQLQEEINIEKKGAFEARQFIEDLRRARNILQKEIDRSDNNNKKLQEDYIAKHKYHNEKRNELQGLSKKMEQFNKTIQILDKEKQNYELQFAQAQAKYFHSLDEIKLKDSLISEFQKKNIETEAKLKQQQNLYETVRSDRNLYSKNYTEKQQEIEEMRRRYKIVNHQISQLKEEIEAKGNALSKEHIEHKKKDITIGEQTKTLDKYNTDIEEKEKKIKTYLAEISKLHFIIKESQQQQQKLKEEFDLVVAERDILSTQLIRRISETQLLYEKIKINESTLKKGEEQYRERLGNIDMLKTKIADLKREIKVFKREANTIKDLFAEIHNLTKELTEERLKRKSISEEMEHPMNVHRWRKLEATDSENYELMTKIQSLQKRLIQKTEEVVYKEKLVLEKDKDLTSLKDEMKRKPGLEEERMIPIYEENLRQKESQMKAMEQELNMYQSHINEYKLEINRLNKELQQTKKRYFEQKKREQQQRDIRVLEEGQPIQTILPEKKMVGGGFALQR